MTAMTLTPQGKDLVVALLLDGAETVSFSVPTATAIQIAGALAASPSAHRVKAPHVSAAVARFIDQISPYVAKEKQ